MKKSHVGRALISIGQELISGCPDLSDDEMDEIYEQIMDIRSGTVWYSKSDAADYLRISIRTFERLVHDGFVPKGQHRKGFKELAWRKRDLDEYVRQNRH